MKGKKRIILINKKEEKSKMKIGMEGKSKIYKYLEKGK